MTNEVHKSITLHLQRNSQHLGFFKSKLYNDCVISGIRALLFIRRALCLILQRRGFQNLEVGFHKRWTSSELDSVLYSSMDSKTGQHETVGMYRPRMHLLHDEHWVARSPLKRRCALTLDGSGMTFLYPTKISTTVFLPYRLPNQGVNVEEKPTVVNFFRSEMNLCSPIECVL